MHLSHSTFDDDFETLVDQLSITPFSNDVLARLTHLIEQRTYQSCLSFDTQEIESLFALEHWAWQQISYDSHRWIHQSKYFNLFHRVASFNTKLILNYDNIETETKALLLIPTTLDPINRIFEKVNHMNDDIHPFISIASLWFNNLALFIRENPQVDNFPIICHINEYIGHNYVMTDQYKFYLSQLEQQTISQTIFTSKQLFYISTCSFSLSSYLAAKPLKFICTGEDLYTHIGSQYLNIINIHSHTMQFWSKDFMICITHLISLICACSWWSTEKLTSTKIFFSTEQISNDLIQGLIRIISYEPFHKEIKKTEFNDTFNMFDIIVKFLLYMLQVQNLSFCFRSNVLLPDVLLKLVENSPSEKFSLCANAVLGEILTDEKLKELKMTDSMYAFFLHMLEKSWHHPLKKYKQIPLIYLLRGIFSLSKSDAIQQKVANGNDISLFIEMCDEYPAVYDIIWALSFNQDIQQQLRSNLLFISKLTQLSKYCDNEQMRKAIDGILWNLQANRDNRPISETKKFDIMISYSHKEKALCKQIYDELTKAGYRIWIDFDQMHGNVMDAMAQAIEQSTTVIICMSEQYRKSNYCRAEAQYAFQRERKIVPILLQKHYKPDGWLLFLIGQLLYVDFTKYEFPRAIGMLFNELKATDITEIHAVSMQPKQDTFIERIHIEKSPATLVLQPIIPEKISDWTQKHVQEWLIQHNLNQMTRLLTDFNGLSLLFFDSIIENGDTKLIPNLLQEDSLRKTGQSLSLVELSRFRSLMNEEKQSLRAKTSKQQTKFNTNDGKKRSFICCRMM